MQRGRRHFLTSAAALAVAAGAAAVPARAARVRKASPVSLEFTPLTARVALLSGAGANIVVAQSDAGLILVDGGLDESRVAVRSLLTQRFGNAPLAWLFNTHWHREQTGLNEIVGREGGVICAHENTRLWLATEFYVDWQDRTYAPLPAAALPSRRFYDREVTTVGDRELRYGRLPNAHTDGDLYVYFPDDDVLAVGGSVTPGAYPLMDYSTGGWLGGVVEASKALLKLAGSKTRIVAASGSVLGRDALEQQLELATVLRDRVVEQIKLGKSVQDMLDAGITREFDGRYGDPQFFLRSAYRGLWGHIRELGVA